MKGVIMPLEDCDCLTAKYKHLLIPRDDEGEFEDELAFTAFNFCPFCGRKVERNKDNDRDSAL